MKICIDAGHNYSGVDTGAIGRRSREQDNTFEIADRLKNILEGAGHSVMLTRPTLQTNLGRTTNEALSLRAQMSNQFGVDVFVSIHNNSGGGVGAETYIYAMGGKAEEYAKDVQAELVLLGRRNRGVKTENFAVLRLTNAPAILVEVGFIDNVTEEQWILSHFDEIAAAIARGLGVNAPNNKEDETMINELKQEVERLKNRVHDLEHPMIYGYVDENMPGWARPTIQKLMRRGLLHGNEHGNLQLTHDMLRMLVVGDRAGLYD